MDIQIIVRDGGAEARFTLAYAEIGQVARSRYRIGCFVVETWGTAAAEPLPPGPNPLKSLTFDTIDEAVQAVVTPIHAINDLPDEEHQH